MAKNNDGLIIIAIIGIAIIGYIIYEYYQMKTNPIGSIIDFIKTLNPFGCLG